MFFFFPLLCIIQTFQNINYANPYNILFLKGSRIKKEFYSPFFHQFQTEFKQQYPTTPLTIQIGDYFPKTPPQNNTLLIGHSFGGFFALLQAIEYQERIKGCVLINSHFNQRMKMPYFPLTIDKVKQPTLFLLNHQDKQLPLSKAMDDYHVYRHPYLPNPPPRKEFRIRPGTHFSSFTNPTEIQQTIQEIFQFIHTLNSTANNVKSEEYRRLDKICEWQLPETRNYYHLPAFLRSKPGIYNCLYHPGNLFKTRNFPKTQLKQVLLQEIQALFSVSNIPVSIEIQFKETYLPLGLYYSNIQYIRNGFFPYSLLRWLFQEPNIEYFITPYPRLVVELLVLPIIDNIVYYKLPNKLRFLEI
jgi:hypothetical protein